MRPSRSLIGLVLFLALFVCFPLPAPAQSGDRAARLAQWDGYALPKENFVRFVEKTKGYSLWHPAEWRASSQPDGGHVFSGGDNGPNVHVVTEEIPDGYGVANYATAVLQQFRNQQINLETMVVRRVLIGGVEGREFSFEIEPLPGHVAHETIWLAAIGPRAYLFMLATQPENLEQHEPYFKRLMMSVRFGAAGHWNEEFEGLHARFAETVATGAAAAGREVEAALLADSLRTGQEPAARLIPRLVELAARAPDAALDLLTDQDPQVRAAGIAMIGQSNNPHATEALLWALTDKDAYCSSLAARELAVRGPAALAALKGKLAMLAEDAGAVLRTGAAFGDEAARELAEELFKTGDSKAQLAGLQLALVFPLKGLALPYAALFASSDQQVLNAAVEAIRTRRPADAVPALLKLLNGDAAQWAARALGEVATIEIAEQLSKRVNEIDARLGVIVVKGNPSVAVRKGKSQASAPPPPPPPPRPSPKAKRSGKAASGTPGGVTILAPLDPSKDFKSQPEAVRLAMVRGQLDEAVAKIKFRDRYAKAPDEAARRAIYQEARNDSTLGDWAEDALREPRQVEPAQPIISDSERLKDAPTTGETLFPHSATLYLMAPNFEEALRKFDAALAGVQMETVRDQMTFALLAKTLKAQLAIKLNAEGIKDAGAALGLDLKAPMALAAWPAPDSQDRTATRSAVVVRVADRARFERLLGLYQKEIGGFDSFATVASSLARFAAALPAAAPLFMSAATEFGRFGSRRTKQPLRTAVYWRQESLGQLPITAIEKLAINWMDAAERETIYLAYLGSTAILAPTRAALVDLLQTDHPRIAESKAFTQARAETGEVVFFSQLGALFRDSLPKGKDSEDAVLEAIARVLGTETGALRLTPSSWETTFHLNLSDNEWMKSIRPFKMPELAAARELLPAHTVFYAGAVVEPMQLLVALRSLGASKEKRTPLDDELEKTIFPSLQGEAAFALLNLSSWLGTGERGSPAMIFALRLKSSELARHFREGKLLASATRVPDATALGSPVATLDEISEQIHFTVTDNYLVLADSVETLRLLEAKEKFAATRGFVRSTAALPDDLVLFATYNLEAAFDEARAAAKDESSRGLLNVVSALVHAFHSQRAYLVARGHLLEGKLAVAFDREGRYAVGKLDRDEFDVANALVVPKGLNIAQPTRAESLRLRVTAKQPGIIARVRDDASKFPWQRVETSDDSSLIFASTARRIPEKQTIKLPAKGDELAPYLRPTARINSAAPQIVNLAKQIAGDDRDGRSVARKLGEWTHANLKWKRVESVAIETLASREADCLEHAELYVALARALGLPARVVTGAAFSGGSFGAHAWVEIYLGQWVEVDPTWGLTDYVDSTHLRFDGDGFISYAMLDQIELEVVEMRSFIADYQRDPLRLVKELSTAEADEKAETSEKHELAFDLALTAEQALGAGVFARLDDKQRAAVITAFDRAVAEAAKPWATAWSGPARILASEIKGERATIFVLRSGDLLRLTLAARDGAWYITEIEDLDDARPALAEALRAALHPAASRSQVRRLTYSQVDRALKQVEQLIAAEGESAPLLLLKAQVLASKQFDEELERATAPDSPERQKKEPSPDQASLLLKQIIARWPDFAPAHYALANRLSPDDDAAEQAIESLRQYAKLMPIDPRPWHDLGQTFEQLKRFAEAEAAYREAAERDRDDFRRHTTLASFYLKRDQAEKAKASASAAFKLAPDVESVFNELGYHLAISEESEQDKEEIRRFEELLRAFPKELASQAGWRWLAQAQQWQEQYDAALKTMQRVLALGPEASDQVKIAELNRAARRFAAALAAADQAIKLDAESAEAHFERACALAQLGRHRDAIAALKQAIALDDEMVESLEEPDLKPLAELPEFKALTAPEQQPKPEKEKSLRNRAGKRTAAYVSPDCVRGVLGTVRGA